MARFGVFIGQPPELVSIVMGCKGLEDCQQQAGEVSNRFMADVAELQHGTVVGTNGTTVAMLADKNRLTFAGRCNPDAMGHCALFGMFSGTTQDMAASQDMGLYLQSETD